MDTQFKIRTGGLTGTTDLFIPVSMVDGPYDGLEQDLRKAGLLMSAEEFSNATVFGVLGAPEKTWMEALRRWLVDRTPESLQASLYPGKRG